MTTYWDDLKTIYQASWRFMLVCPLLFLVPVFGELVQHVAEIGIGMYASSDAFQAMAYDDARQLTGTIKVLLIACPGYWFARYLGFGGDAIKAKEIETPAISLWLVVYAYMTILALPALYPAELSSLIGLDQEMFLQGFGIFSLVFFILGIYLYAWTIGWPLGNSSINWWRSIQLMNGSFFRSIAYLVGAVLPLMVMHYGLGHLGIGAEPHWLWLIMFADSLLVGFLALTLVGGAYFAALRACEKAGVSLLPS